MASNASQSRTLFSVIAANNGEESTVFGRAEWLAVWEQLQDQQSMTPTQGLRLAVGEGLLIQVAIGPGQTIQGARCAKCRHALTCGCQR